MYVLSVHVVIENCATVTDWAAQMEEYFCIPINEDLDIFKKLPHDF